MCGFCIFVAWLVRTHKNKNKNTAHIRVKKKNVYFWVYVAHREKELLFVVVLMFSMYSTFVVHVCAPVHCVWIWLVDQSVTSLRTGRLILDSVQCWLLVCKSHIWLPHHHHHYLLPLWALTVLPDHTPLVSHKNPLIMMILQYDKLVVKNRPYPSLTKWWIKLFVFLIFGTVSKVQILFIYRYIASKHQAEHRMSFSELKLSAIHLYIFFILVFVGYLRYFKFDKFSNP